MKTLTKQAIEYVVLYLQINDLRVGKADQSHS